MNTANSPESRVRHQSAPTLDIGFWLFGFYWVVQCSPKDQKSRVAKMEDWSVEEINTFFRENNLSAGATVREGTDLIVYIDDEPVLWGDLVTRNIGNPNCLALDVARIEARVRHEFVLSHEKKLQQQQQPI